MKGDVGERQLSRQTWWSCEPPSCSLMLWWSFSLWHVTCQLIWVGWTSACSLANIGQNLIQRSTCGLGTPQSRELDSLEPVFLHPPKADSKIQKYGRWAGGGWSHRQKNYLACVWDSFPLCCLVKHVLLTKVIQQLFGAEVQQVSTTHRQS